MKSFKSTLAALCSVAVVAQGVVLTTQGAAVAQAPSQNQKELRYDGSALLEAFELGAETKRTKYENREVPDTCSRQVQTGTRQECHDTTREECGPDKVRRVCEDVSRRECTPITRRECSNTTRRECTPVTRRECEREPRRSCRPVTRQKCDRVTRRECSGTKRECRGSGAAEVCKETPDCRDVADTVCRDVTEQECETTYENVCRDVRDSVCRDVPDTVCRDVSDSVCRTVNDTVCRDVREPNCWDVPYRECDTVPVYKTETYACTRTIQVPVGEELVSATRAFVAVDAAACATQAKADETLKFVLEGSTSSDVKLTLARASDRVLLVADKKVEVKQVDSVRREVKASIKLSPLVVSEITAPLTQGVQDVSVDAEVARFTLGKVVHKDFLQAAIGVSTEAGAVVLKPDFLAADKLVFADLPVVEGKPARTAVTLSLASVGLQGKLKPGRYKVSAKVRLAAPKMPAGGAQLLNPGSLPRLNDATGEGLSVIRLQNGAEILAMTARGIQDARLSTASLAFSLGKVIAPELLEIRVKAVRKKEVRFEKTLSGKDFAIEASASDATRSMLTIPLERLEPNKNVGKGSEYELEIVVRLDRRALQGVLADEELARIQDATFAEKVKAQK